MPAGLHVWLCIEPTFLPSVSIIMLHRLTFHALGQEYASEHAFTYALTANLGSCSIATLPLPFVHDPRVCHRIRPG